MHNKAICVATYTLKFVPAIAWKSKQVENIKNIKSSIHTANIFSGSEQGQTLQSEKFRQ